MPLVFFPMLGVDRVPTAAAGASQLWAIDEGETKAELVSHQWTRRMIRAISAAARTKAQNP